MIWLLLIPAAPVVIVALHFAYTALWYGYHIQKAYGGDWIQSFINGFNLTIMAYQNRYFARLKRIWK